MGKTNASDYVFAVGKIRALERFLISAEVFEEALDTPLPEALRLFAESDLYSDELMQVKESRGLERILTEGQVALRKMVAGLLLDKELLALLELDSLQCAAKLLEGSCGGFFKDYLRYWIDMQNIKTFLRLYILKESQQELSRHLVCEGFIKRADLLQWYTQELSVFLNKLEYVHKNDGSIMDYTFHLREAIKELQEKRSFVALEGQMQSFLMRMLLPAKYITFGPEPLLAYYFAKVNEMNLMRLIILAKLNGFSRDLVKERLNSVYA
jgi:V/A-type H+-transporting ATPase subunit C